jgi:hypothetical protein
VVGTDTLLDMDQQKKLRVNFDIEETYHRAFTIAAGLRGGSLAALFRELADQHLQEEIELAKKRLEQEEKATPPRRGRPRKAT